MKIYIVCGRTGEYDSHSEWSVKAFSSLEKAQELCDKLNNWCKHKEKRDWNCPYDKYFHEDCLTGTEYGILTLDYEE